MMRLFVLLALLASERALPSPETLVRFPHGTYLENLAVTRDGAVVFTSYFDRTLRMWRDGQASIVATLADHPVNVLPDANGYVVLTHGASFLDGPAALKGTNQLVWVDARGAVVRSVEVPDLVFGNGMVRDDDKALLVTDAAAGVIRRIDLATGASTIWLDDPVMKADPTQPKGKLGVNGLKRDGTHILFSNSATRRVFRIAVAHGKPVGAPVLIGEAEGADDFAVGKDTIYLATHRTRIVAIARGHVDTIADRDVDGATSVALAPDHRSLYVLGTGGLFEGKDGEAALVRVPLRQ